MTPRIVERFQSVHGDRYDYSNVVYDAYNKKVKIGCSIHGTFLQSPESHWRGRGCRKCAREFSATKCTKSTEYFIAKSRLIHGDYYQYTRVKYKASKSKVEIICPVHGIFEQLPNNHLTGQGCPQCSNDNNRGAYSRMSDCILKSIKNATLYYIEFTGNGEDFIKIGVTKNIRMRLYQFNKYTVENMHLIECPDMYQAFQLEQELLNNYRDFKYVPKLKFDGYTECFTHCAQLKDHFNGDQHSSTRT